MLHTITCPRKFIEKGGIPSTKKPQEDQIRRHPPPWSPGAERAAPRRQVNLHLPKETGNPRRDHSGRPKTSPAVSGLDDTR